MIEEPTQSEFNDHYKGILENLLGRSLPATISLMDDEELKPLAPEVVAMHADISSLLLDPRLVSIFVYFRKRGREVAEKYHPATATENELRWAGSCNIIPDDMARGLVRFVAQIDELQLKIAKHLDEKQKKGDTPEQPSQPRGV